MGRGAIQPRNGVGDAIYSGGQIYPSISIVNPVLPYFVILNNDVVPWVAVLTTKTGAQVTRTFNPGMIQSWPVETFVTAAAALPAGGTAASFQMFYSPVDVEGPPVGTSSGGDIVVNNSLGETVSGWFAVATVPLGKKWLLNRIAVKVVNASGNAIDVIVGTASAAGAIDQTPILHESTPAVAGVYYYDASPSLPAFADALLNQGHQQWAATPVLGSGDVIEAIFNGVFGVDSVFVYWQYIQEPL